MYSDAHSQYSHIWHESRLTDASAMTVLIFRPFVGHALLGFHLAAVRTDVLKIVCLCGWI